MGDFADRGGLAGSIDTYEQNHTGPRRPSFLLKRRGIRLKWPQDFRNFVRQSLLNFFRTNVLAKAVF